MTGWNLPPGCEVWHIPGNRPEDVAWDEAVEALTEAQVVEWCTEARHDCAHWDDEAGCALEVVAGAALGGGDVTDCPVVYAKVEADLAEPDYPEDDWREDR